MKEVGVELDALVALKVMELVEHASYAGTSKVTLGWAKPGHSGFMYSKLPKYSEDIAAAWEVLAALASRGLGDQQLTFDESGWFITVGDFNLDGNNYHASEANTAPHGICLAALKAVRYKVEDK